MRRSREIPPVPSLHRPSTDGLILMVSSLSNVPTTAITKDHPKHSEGHERGVILSIAIWCCHPTSHIVNEKLRHNSTFPIPLTSLTIVQYSFH